MSRPNSAVSLLGRGEESPNGCLNWTGHVHPRFGYALASIDGRWMHLHRAVYKEIHGAIPRGKVVMHNCDNRRCINPKHLSLGTNADNMRDAAVKNRMRHKLSIDEVREVRAMARSGFIQAGIAKKFGIHQGSVSQIINRKRRTHIR